MKKRLLLSTFVLSALLANAQWTNQNVPLPYEGYLDAVKMVDANIVWGTTISVTGGTAADTKDFVRTIDGGATWTHGTINATPAGMRTSNIFPIDDQTCYASLYNPTAAGGKIYKTTNGGTSWTQVGTNMFTSATSFPDVVYFWDAQNGIAIGDPYGSPLKYEIYLTTDSGATWTAVPAANLPTLTNASEYGITNLYDAEDGRIWFGTTYGDVYRSIDMGQTWTKSATGLPAYVTSSGGRQDISVVAFTDSLNGIVAQINDVGYVVVNTNDGGLTWTTITPTGAFYPSDITGVPGSGKFVSAGSNGTFGFGTSYSDDNGLTWNSLDTNVSHTSVDFIDANNGYGGEYIPLGGPGGAWKFSGVLGVVACGDSLISSGTGSVNDSLICYNDTLVFTVTGAFPPSTGGTHGFSVIVSSGDLGQSNDPLNQPGILGGTGVIGFPANPFNTVLPNDGSIFPAGIYYFTPVVYGNANGSGNVTQLTLDPSCTYTGPSVMVNLLADGDPLCNSSAIYEVANSGLTLSAFFADKNILDVNVNLNANASVNVTIYNLMGVKVFEQTQEMLNGSNHQKLNLEKLSSGTYIINVTTERGTVSQKLIKL